MSQFNTLVNRFYHSLSGEVRVYLIQNGLLRHAFEKYLMTQNEKSLNLAEFDQEGREITKIWIKIIMEQYEEIISQTD